MFIIILCIRCSFIYADDINYWNANTFVFPMDKKVNIKVVQEFRFSSGLDTFIQYTGLEKIFSENMIIAGWHKLIEKHRETDWIEEHRIVGDMIIKQKFLSAVFTNRNRFEYGITKPFRLYRNKSKISFSSMFVSNEFFLRFFPSEFAENRFYVGMIFKMFLNQKISLYYMLRNKKYNNSWEDSKIFGLSLTFKF